MSNEISPYQDNQGITVHPEQVPIPMQTAEALAHFRIAPFRFVLRADTDIGLSSYKGSAFRGAFGHALKRIVCMTKQPQCTSCMLLSRCLYPYIFETDRSDSDLSSNKSKDIPRPFVLVPPLTKQETYSIGEIFSCDLILIGKVIENLPYFICTMEAMGEQGLGKGHGRFHVEHAEFHILFSRLLDRIASLSEHHHGIPLDLDIKRLKHLSESVSIKTFNTFWQDWERYSNRQQTRMTLGGTVRNSDL